MKEILEYRWERSCGNKHILTVITPSGKFNRPGFR